MTFAVSTEKTRDALRILNANIHVAVQRTLREAMAVAVADAKSTDLWKDGDPPVTRGTIHAEEGLGRGTVSAAGASLFLEGGTRPHAIVATNGQALRFMVNGAVIFRRSVNHPGTAPRPFMQHARDWAAKAAAFAADLNVAYAIEHIA